ncbi:hypothetical protein [Laspinema olomoucense]|nr:MULTISPECIES: hypothetical protein [unclassified Laspinema]
MEYAIVSNKPADAASWMEMREGEEIFRVAIVPRDRRGQNRVCD